MVRVSRKKLKESRVMKIIAIFIAVLAVLLYLRGVPKVIYMGVLLASIVLAMVGHERMSSMYVCPKCGERLLNSTFGRNRRRGIPDEKCIRCGAAIVVQYED